VFDRILDLLFGHLDQRAVLIFRWQWLGPEPRDPRVQLQRMTGGVRGGCGWLLGGPATASGAEEGMQEGEARAWDPACRRASEPGGVQMSETEGNVEKPVTENRRSHGAEMCAADPIPSGPGLGSE
jgi:hypothetical protein